WVGPERARPRLFGFAGLRGTRPCIRVLYGHRVLSLLVEGIERRARRTKFSKLEVAQIAVQVDHSADESAARQSECDKLGIDIEGLPCERQFQRITVRCEYCDMERTEEIEPYPSLKRRITHVDHGHQDLDSLSRRN